MRIAPHPKKWALVWVALGASLWGTDSLFRRPLTAELNSAQIVLNEHLILTIALVPWLWRSRREWLALRPAEWRAVVGIAWCGSALGTMCFTEAIRIGNPTTAIFLQKTQPLFAALMARALLHEPLGSRFWISLLLALIATYLVVFGPVLVIPAMATLQAPLLALAAAVLWGASTVLGRFALRSLSFTTLTALRIIAASPLLLVLAPVYSHAPLAIFPARQMPSLLFMALVPGLIALLIYYRGLAQTRASFAAIAELSFPATATLLNWLFLGIRVSAVQIAGFVLLWLVILNLERAA